MHVELRDPNVEAVKENLRPAAQHLLATARLLNALQSQPDRVLPEETAVADTVNRLLRVSYSVGEESVGIAAVRGSGIQTTDYSPKAWLDRKDGPWPWSPKSSRRWAIEHGYNDQMKPFEGSKVAGHFLLHGFMRGDLLGYREELGNRWYLMFGWREKYYAPVNGLSSVNLKVVNTGF